MVSSDKYVANVWFIRGALIWSLWHHWPSSSNWLLLLCINLQHLTRQPPVCCSLVILMWPRQSRTMHTFPVATGRNNNISHWYQRLWNIANDNHPRLSLNLYGNISSVASESKNLFLVSILFSDAGARAPPDCGQGELQPGQWQQRGETQAGDPAHLHRRHSHHPHIPPEQPRELLRVLPQPVWGEIIICESLLNLPISPLIWRLDNPDCFSGSFPQVGSVCKLVKASAGWCVDNHLLTASIEIVGDGKCF